MRLRKGCNKFEFSISGNLRYLGVVKGITCYEPKPKSLFQGTQEWSLARIPLVFVCCIASIALSAQGMGRYYDPRSFSLIDLTDHLEVNFTWTLKGKSQAFMNEGLNEYIEGNLETSLTNLNIVIQQDSTFWPAYYYRALCFKNSHKDKESIRDFQKVISLNKKIIEAYLELGELYQSKRKFIEAKDLYDKALDLDESSAAAHYFLGTLFLQRSEKNRALRQFQLCNELNPHFPNAYFIQGILKFTDKKDPKETISYFDQSLKADSSFMPALFWRGYLNAVSGSMEKTFVDWNRLIMLSPGNTFYLMMRGFLYIEMEKYDEAFADLRKAILAREQDENKYTGGQTVLDKTIDLQSAASYMIRKGYGLKEESFSLIKKSFCLVLAEKREEALKALNQSAAMEPSSTVFYMKAITLEQLKQYDSSLLNYNKALKLDNDIFDAHKKRAIYRYENNNWRGAYADLAEMRRIQPNANVTLRLGGIIKYNMKDYYGCIIDLAAFVKMDTSDLEVWITKARCHESVSDFKSALVDYEQCIRLTEDNREFYAQVYQNQILLKDSLAGLKTITKMVRIWPKDRELKLALAEILLDFDMYDSAKHVLDQVILELDQQKKQNAMIKNSINYKVGRANALYLLGRTFVEKGLPDEALVYLDESLEFTDGTLHWTPSKNDRLFYRTKLLLKMDRKKDAIKDLKKLKEANYKPAEIYYDQYLPH